MFKGPNNRNYNSSNDNSLYLDSHLDTDMTTKVQNVLNNFPIQIFKSSGSIDQTSYVQSRDGFFPDALRNNVLFKFVRNSELNKLRLNKVLTNWKGNDERIVNSFQWTHNIQKCENTNTIIITIQETFMGTPTLGGSSFTTYQDSEHTRDYCPIRDLFNGTYLARCTVHEDMTQIEGILHFVNFAALYSVR